MKKHTTIKTLFLAALLVVVGCYGSRSEDPVLDPLQSEPVASNGGSAEPAKVLTSIKGTRYDVSSLLVPGQITIVKFFAPW